MKKLLLLSFLLTAGIIQGLLAQGATTASMSGTITDEGELPLIGASVVAIHTPSGTQYGTITDVEGNYRIANMRVGGPYSIEVSYVGYEVNELPNVFLALGERRRFDNQLKQAGIVLDEFTIIASRDGAGLSSGVSTNIGTKELEDMPTLQRNLADFARLTPEFRSSPGGGLSFAGQNNRYNAIYIDGAVNNDVFGLAGNGQNGGQTGIAPFSIDAIDQIQVVLSPYDVTYGGFAGAGINAVTKSGTNNLEGTVYYFMQNEGLAGSTNGQLSNRTGGEREPLNDFNNQLIGASLGGALIKDKLFFFANAEIQNDITPAPFAGEYDGNTSLDEIASLQQFLLDEYDYDAGVFGSKVDETKAQRYFAKLDYNINDQHKISLRHNYTNGENLNRNASGLRNINFANNGVFFPTTTNSTTFEWNGNFGNTMSNSLIIGYTSVRDDRDPIGQDFPRVRIDDGQGRIQFGSEAFSTANQLDQDVLTITNNFKLYKGDHTITVGTHNEFMSFYNLFIRQNFGEYRYSSLEDFYNDNASRYFRSYSLVDDLAGDGSAAAAEFNAMQLGFYVQDEWLVNNKFTLTGGVRVDIPILTTDPNTHESFNSSTIPALSEVYDLKGAQGGTAPSGQIMLSPRIGANYLLNETTTIRGGAGIFTSRIPFVWPGGMYTNNGVTIGTVNQNDLPEIPFIAEVQDQYENPNFAVPSGQVDLFAADFRYPQVFRTNIGVDKQFGNGWYASVDGMFTKTLNNVFYSNVNSLNELDFNWTNGGDNRAVYTSNDNGSPIRIDDRYTSVILATNTNEGYSYNFTARVDKEFGNGANFGVAYSYGDAEAIFEGTSSQNSSQWRGAMSINGRNDAVLGRSDFSPGGRVVANLGVNLKTSKDDANPFRFSVFYNGQSGSPYSYVYGTDDGENVNNESGDTGRNRSLIYVPANEAEANLVDANGMTAEEQWVLLDRFITEDDYLSDRRGQYVGKNSNRTPFTHQFDLKISKAFDVDFTGQGDKLVFTFDVFNVGNLLNKEWGVQFGNPFDYRLIDFQGYEDDGTTPTFSFSEENLGNERFNILDFSSRWRGRFGIRYIFN
jgi:hypothetical protein